MAPRYRVMAPAFFQPNLVQPGSIIEWDGQPNNALEPLNAEAEAKMAEYRKTHRPGAAVDQLPMIEPAKIVALPPKDAPTIDSPGIAKPAVTDGGKILEDLIPKAKVPEILEDDPDDPKPAAILHSAPPKKKL